MYNVYVIGHHADLYPFLDSYVGVTNNVNRRWKEHLKSNSFVGRMIRQFGWNLSNMRVIHSGPKDECYNLERKLRPFPMIGLNEAVGGFGGYSRYDAIRNQKLSDALKGRKITWHIDRPKNIGIDNPRAKKWVLTSPSGETFICHGNLGNFLRDKNLSGKLLRFYDGLPVPEPSVGKLGGYRAKTPELLEQRLNTTGWKLNDFD
jgi:hypothetical protein